MSQKKNAVVVEGEEKLLKLVEAMNELNDAIDPSYAKMAVFLKTGEKSITRYFIKKRTYTDESGIQRWKFIARADQNGEVEVDC